MAFTFHRTHHGDHGPTAVETDADGAVVLRTADGEVVRFSGASPAEVKAKTEEFLAWAS